MKIWSIILFFGLTLSAYAQQVNYNGVTYKVKGKVILKDGVDVTNTITLSEQTGIKNALAKAKSVKKTEKKLKATEKKQKKAEKELKQKQKAQSNFEKSNKKHDQALKKYEKLKSKGKLSPEDENKWLKKINKLKGTNEKAKRKLKKA